MSEAIKVDNISFSYDGESDVIKNISFNVEKGSYVTLVGHNGSGKSTLAKLIANLLLPTKGKIFIDGHELIEKSDFDVHKFVGIVFQNPDNQFIGITVEDDIAFGLENRSVERSKMQKLVKTFAAKVGMDKFLDKEPSELSGGQKQRVAIAGILALNLKIVIFDEATSMLDPEGVEEIKKLILDMKKEDPELTFISITHDIEEAYLSDYCILLNKGTIYKEGKPEEIFDDAEAIQNLGLDIPYVLKVINALDEKGISVPKSIHSFEELAKYICQSK